MAALLGTAHAAARERSAERARAREARPARSFSASALAVALGTAVLTSISGCAPVAAIRPTTITDAYPLAATTAAAQATPAAVTDAVLEVRPQLRVSIHAPAVARYQPTSLGIGSEYVAIRLTNTSGQPVAVDHLHATFSATREGVEFPCEERVGGGVRDRDLALLEPQQSATFERMLDCTMPLPGLYHVRTYVHFGESDRASRAARNLAGSFDLQVVGEGKRAQPYPSRDGLYAIMTGTPLTGPATADDLAKGGYKVVIALINAGLRPSRVGAFHFSYFVYKENDPLPCSGESATFAGPSYLASGRIHVVESRVACVLAVEGHYFVVGKLVIEREGEGIEIGRLHFDVTRDPARRDPLLFVPYP